MLWTATYAHLLLYSSLYDLSIHVCRQHRMQKCSFEPSWTIVLLFECLLLSSRAFICVQPPVCVGGIVKCKNCISSGTRRLAKKESRRAEGVVWKCMHTCCLLQPPTLPLPWLPTSEHLESAMKRPGHGCGQQPLEDGEPAALSRAKRCQKAIMEDGYLLRMPTLCLINIGY